MDMKQRKHIRLTEYDYALEGAYFVTLCTQSRARLFEMELPNAQAPRSAANIMIHKWIRETKNKFPGICIDKYVIMPDHLHVIITINRRQTDHRLPDVVRFFKTMTTNEYIRAVKSGEVPPFDGKLWQKSYYDHVIRNQRDYDEIWQYIENNPAKWMMIHGKM